MPAYNREAICQFCNTKIIPPKKGFRSSANGNYICEDCVKLLGQALDVRGKSDGKAKAKKRNKKMTPREIKKELDKYIIDQDSAKISIAIAVYNHYKRMDIKSDVKLSKSNVLLIGPTGSGKTLLAQTVAKMLDVPFAIADCTSLTEAGYVGDDVETILTKLLRSADGSVEKAERGIIFLDERRNPNEKYVQVNTENILFICGGAFPGLEEIINKRTAKDTSIGFGANVDKGKEKSISEALSQVETDDLVKYGLIPEIIGRLPVIVSLNELDEEAMVKILTEPKDCIVNQYKEFFKYDGIELEFTPDALKDIAKETIKRKTGARGLRGILEGILKDSMFNLPDEDDVEKCIVEKGGKVNVVRKQAEKSAG